MDVAAISVKHIADARTDDDQRGIGERLRGYRDACEQESPMCQVLQKIRVTA
jgi:hypothetical protein